MAEINYTAPPQPATMDDPFELFKVVDNYEPTEESILAYLFALYTNSPTGCMEVEQVYEPDTLEYWRKACKEFPELISETAKVGRNLHMKTLLMDALTPFTCSTTEKIVVTLQDRIDRTVALHMAERAPGKARELNTQAVARYRARARNDGSPECTHATVVKQAYDAYMQACRQRREAEKIWAEHIAEKKQAWLAVRYDKQSL